MTEKRFCSSCGAEYFFAATKDGKLMPVDWLSAHAPDGTAAVSRDADGKLMCRILRKGESPAAGETRATVHWATCPNAVSHRSARRKP